MSKMLFNIHTHDQGHRFAESRMLRFAGEPGTPPENRTSETDRVPATPKGPESTERGAGDRIQEAARFREAERREILEMYKRMSPDNLQKALEDLGPQLDVLYRSTGELRRGSEIYQREWMKRESMDFEMQEIILLLREYDKMSLSELNKALEKVEAKCKNFESDLKNWTDDAFFKKNAIALEERQLSFTELSGLRQFVRALPEDFDARAKLGAQETDPERQRYCRMKNDEFVAAKQKLNTQVLSEVKLLKEQGIAFDNAVKMRGQYMVARIERKVIRYKIKVKS